MAYKGKFTPKNISKYKGDYNNIQYRSLWERNTFRWLDENEKVVAWNSEEIIIPYFCRTDGRPHRYFVDLWIRLDSGKTMIVEIKPAAQCIQPEKKAKKNKRYLTEVLTYAKNISKWEAAKAYAIRRGWEFYVWDETSLKALGIKIL